jgi:ketosteroid isomerase-like protein
MDAEAVRELIARYDAAWNEQDLETIDALHAPGIVFHNHTAGEAVEGAQAVRDHIAKIFERWPDMRFTGRRQYFHDDFCASEWTARATASDGRRLEWDGVDLFPIVDGKIARKDVYSTSGAPRVLE